MFLLFDAGVVEYLSNGGVAENHKDFKELRYSECLTNFNCNGKNGNSDGSITHSFQLKSAYDSNLMPYTNYTYDFKVKQKTQINSFPFEAVTVIYIVPKMSKVKLSETPKRPLRKEKTFKKQTQRGRRAGSGISGPANVSD